MMTYLLKGWHIRNEHFSLKNIKDKYVQCACKLLQRFNCPMLCLKSPESLAAITEGVLIFVLRYNKVLF